MTKPDPPDRPRISRRTFVRWGVGGAALLGLGTALGRRAGRYPVAGVEPAELRVLLPAEAAVFAAVAGRILDPGPAGPGPDPGHAVRFLDGFLARAHPEVRGELRALLGAFDRVGPWVALRARRFTDLDAAGRDAVLRTWERGPHPLRMGFAALKQISFMAHYGREETWPAIGYGGPLVEPGFAGGEEGWLDPAWFAPDGDARADSPGKGGRR